GAVDPTGADPGSPEALVWHLRTSTQGDLPAFAFGNNGWLPVAGDWAGLGRAGIGAVDPSDPAGPTWHLRDTASPGHADAVFAYGPLGASPAPGPFNFPS